MSRAYEELDVQPTSMGELILRRRRVLSLGTDVHEVLLDGRFLMSSLVTDSERALTRLALAELAAADPARRELAVLVGGLGLGYTAAAALDSDAVAGVTVVEALAPVIDWHRRGLVPLGDRLARDPRCRLVPADFFAAVDADPAAPDTPLAPAASADTGAGAGAGFDMIPGFDMILVDIDHSPSARLSPAHASFYEQPALQRLAAWLRPGGVFAFWSADLPEPWFEQRLAAAFPQVRSEVVEFDNPLADLREGNTIYLARRGE